MFRRSKDKLAGAPRYLAKRERRVSRRALVGYHWRYDLLEDRTLLSLSVPNLVSVNGSGNGTGNSNSFSQSISGDGTLEVFASNANNLVAGLTDNNGTTDVFLRNLVTGTTTLLSVSSSGTAVGNSTSDQPVISTNGRFVAFRSNASNLTATPTDGNSHIFVRDLVTNTTTVVSVNNTTGALGNSTSDQPSISDDGNIIAFRSFATNLDSSITDANGTVDVFVHNRTTGTTQIVSVNTAGTGSGNNGSDDPLVSGGGNTVVFRSSATDIAAGVTDTNNTVDIFSRNLVTHTTSIVDAELSSPSAGNSNSAISGGRTISADGRFEVFASNASDLIPGTADTNGTTDVFVRDRQTGKTILVSINAAGTGPGNSTSDQPVISANGRFVAFRSNSTNLTPGGTDGNSQIFVRDLVANTTTVVSQNSSNLALGNSQSDQPSISDDGNIIAFRSFATNLVSGLTDSNGTTDVFVHNVSANTTRLVSINTAGTGTANNFSDSPVVSGGGTTVVFRSDATDIAPGATDANGTVDIFSRNLSTNTTQLVDAELSTPTTGNSTSTLSAGRTISADGRFEVFASNASDLVPGIPDTNNTTDVFVRDRQTGTTALVSINFAGTGTGNTTSDSPVISANGRFVVFRSFSSNLTSGGTDGNSQIFVRDLVAQTTTVVSVNSTSTALGNSTSDQPSISDDGNIVAFRSFATNLDSTVTDSNGTTDVFVHNMSANTTRLISANVAGTASGDNFSDQPLVSGSGATVVFRSQASNVAAGVTETNSNVDIFSRNLTTNVTSLVDAETNAASTGNAGSALATGRTISADGRFEVFASNASDLVAGKSDTNNTTDVFVRDRQTGATTLVSVNTAGTGTGNSTSDSPVISANGRFVVFRSFATNLTSPGTDGNSQIFVRDLVNNTTTVVSVNSTSGSVGNSTSDQPSISDDGNIIAFRSFATNLDSSITDANGNTDVYVHNVSANTTRLVSVNIAGTGSANNSSDNPLVSGGGTTVVFRSFATDVAPGVTDTNNTVDVFSRNLSTNVTSLVDAETTAASTGNSNSALSGGRTISADGRFEVFASNASDLVGGVPDTNSTADVFVRDRQTGITTLVSVNAAGTGVGNNSSDSPVISANGRFVAFRSSSTNLTSPGTDGNSQIFIRDLQTNTTTVVSVSTGGVLGNSVSDSPSISDDGNIVAFRSFANNLVSGVSDSNGTTDIFVRNRSAGTTTLLSVNTGGTATGNGESDGPVVSGDGSTVAFTSFANNLAAGVTDSNNTRDVFVRVLSSGITQLVSINPGGTLSGNNDSGGPVLSANGQVIAFQSDATNLVASDGNGTGDVFVRNLGTGTTTLISQNTGGTQGNSTSDSPSISADGNVVAFRSNSSNLAAGDTNGQSDIFVRNISAGTTVLITSNSAGTDGGNNTSDSPFISADGSTVAFRSFATDLVSGLTDNNGTADVFLRAVSGGPITAISVTPGGATGDSDSGAPQLNTTGSVVAFQANADDLGSGLFDENRTTDVFARPTGGPTEVVSSKGSGLFTGSSGANAPYSVSANGRFVAFASTSINLAANDTNGGAADVFVRDLTAGTTDLISQSTGGVDGNSGSDSASISADGNIVAFRSSANNLAGPDTNFNSDIFVHNRSAGTTVLISANSAGTDGGDNTSDSPFLSADGTMVAFRSFATNLVSGLTDNNSTADVFLRAVSGGPITAISVTPAGATGDGDSGAPQLNTTGSVVAFESNADNIGPGVVDQNRATDVFARPTGGPTEVISGKGTGLFTGSRGANSPYSVSASGQFVAFASASFNLSANDTNGNTSDVFVRDLTGGTTDLISQSTGGVDGNSDSDSPSISADGNLVAFRSTANNLASPDTNFQSDIFVRNRSAGSTVLISANSAGSDGGNSTSDSPFISADGSTVAFRSFATNLVSGLTDNNNTADVFLRAVSGGPITAISVTPAGATGDGDSGLPQLNNTGSVVTFASNADNLGPGVQDQNQATDLFARPTGGPTEVISSKGAGVFTGSNGANSPFSVSANGQFVAFASTSFNLAANDTNGTTSDVFVRDLVAGSTDLISQSTGGLDGNSTSDSASISTDGNVVAFRSSANDLASGDTNFQSDIFVRNRSAGTTVLISANSAGTDGGNSQSDSPFISADGTMVAFRSFATNLVSGLTDNNNTADVFLRAVSGGPIAPISVTPGGATGDSDSSAPQLNTTGSVVAFNSNASNLGPGVQDQNQTSDVFARPTGGPTEMVSSRGPGFFAGGSGANAPFSVSSNGRFVAFASTSINLSINDTNGGTEDVFVRDLTNNTTDLISQSTAGVAGNSTSDSPSISADGNIVAFRSSSNNLASPDGNFQSDIFVRNRTAGTTTLVSVNSAGTDGGNSTSDEPVVSADGGVVAFRSFASNLVSSVTDNNGTADIFVRTLATGVTNVASVTSAGNVTGNSDSGSPVLSANGVRLSFQSNASNLVGAGVTDANNTTDVFASSLVGLAIDNVAHLEGNSGTTDFAFTVTLTQPSAVQVTVQFATADGTATAASGDYVATSGTLTFAPGETTKTIHVTVNGDITPEVDETFFVNLSNATNSDIAVTPGLGTIQNDDATASINDVTVAEGDSGTTDFAFTVTLSVASTQTITIPFATSDGTATAGSDYTAATGTLTFAPGVLTQTVHVSVLGDTTAESDETFFVNLSNPVNTVLARAQGQGTILNDDAAITIGNVAQFEGNSGTTDFVFPVSIPFVSTKTVTVQFATADGTATVANNDYVATSGTLTFLPGQTTQTVHVTVNGDAVSEADETFFVNLTNPTNGAIAHAQGTGTILNDDSAVTINNVTHVEGNSGTTSFTFTVGLTAVSTQQITVVFTTADGSATAGSGDYVAQTGTLTFAPGVTSQTVTVVVNGDTTPEPDETFLVNLSNPTNSTLANSFGIGTILNDDASVSVNNVNLPEGDSGTTDFAFTVSIPFVSTQTVTVQFATADGTATAASGDYTATSGTLTFSPGQTVQTVHVAVNGDTTPEPDEAFFVNLSSPTNATLANSQGTGTIFNDDATVTINDVALDEGNSGTTDFAFTVNLPFASAQTVTVQFATADGTASAPSDYTATSGTLTFAPGQTSQTVHIAVNGDTTPEAFETFVVNLSNATHALIVRNQATGTIRNDDAAVSVSNVTQPEGDSGTTDFAFSVTIPFVSTKTVTVQFATADGTAVAPGDYTATSGTLTFAPGDTVKTVHVAVNGDTTPEPDETFVVNLSNPTNASLAAAQGTGTIQNDDAAITINNVALPEGNTGTTDFAFLVTIPFASTNTVTVQFATADDTATVANNDYVAASGTLTFLPGQVSQTIHVAVNGDTTPEPDEQFTVNLSNPTHATLVNTQGTGTIRNDDASIAIADVSHVEGNSGVSDFAFTVTIPFASTQQITVAFATADGTATVADNDYTATSGTLTFAPGVTSQTIHVSVNGDTTPEGDETFFVNLTNAANAAIGDNQAVGTILNDDASSGFSINDVTLAEGNSGTTAFTFTVTLANALATDATVQFATADGTATAPSDYAATSGTLTFTAGQTTKTVTVQVNGDTTPEADETFVVNLSNATGTIISDTQGLGTIQNDDAAITISDVAAAEGNSGNTPFTFNLSIPFASVLPVTVQFATADGTAAAGTDYTTKSGTVTFNPGQTTQSITVNVTGDTTPEPFETFVVNLSGPTNATLVNSQATGTIQNDDAAITIGNVALPEGDAGTTTFGFGVSIPFADVLPVTVQFATADGTATVAGNDYQSTSGTLTFSPGQTSKTISVNVVGDTTPEPDETFFVNLTNPTNASLVNAQGTGTIQNDDAAISVTNVALPEGNTGTTDFAFQVTIPFASTKTVTVQFATADGTASASSDYTATSGTLTFAPGVTLQTVHVAVNGDTTPEADETFVVNLSNPTNATLVNTQGTGTIQNDDAAITISDLAAPEGNSGNTPFTFHLSIPFASVVPVTVQFTTADGTATAGTDYTTASGTATFNPGQTTQTITVNVMGDTTPEPFETFFVNLSNPTNATLVNNQATGTIQNDDAAITIGNVTAPEGNSGNTPFTFNLSIPFASVLPVTVQFATADGTAVAGTDYTANSGTVTFNPGQTTQSITVNVTGDTTPEPFETFVVNLSNPTNATLTNSQGTGTIQNDDAAISISNVTAPEGNSGNTPFTFTVTIPFASVLPVTVDFATADGTATAAGNDYLPTSGTLTFNPGQTSQTVSVSVVGDTTPEPDETFFVNLTNPTNASLTKPQGIGTIQNDDDAITIGDFTRNEGNSGTTDFVFAVTLPFASTNTITVQYATADGTATAPSDYAATSGTLTFAPGQTGQSIHVAVVGDITVEPDETFFVNLSNPTNATLANTQGTGTILNDDSGAQQADVVMTKTGPATAIAGTNITYLLTLANNGPSDAQAATFVDQLPQHETLVSFHQDSGPGVGGALPPGGVETFTMVVHIDASTPNNTVITNTATGFSSTPDPNGANNVASASTTITTQADVVMTKTGPATAIAGTNITYLLTLANNGPSDAQAATFVDQLPQHETLVSFHQDSGPGVGGALPPGGVETFTMVVHIDASTPDNTVITNTATGFSSTFDPNGANNVAPATTTILAQADLAMSMSGPASAVAGTNVAYSLVLTNNGPSDAQNATFAIHLPAHTSLFSFQQDSGPALGGTLPAGGVEVFTLVLHVAANTPNNTVITNSATVFSTTADPNSANNVGSANTTITTQADVVMTKTGPATAIAGTNITYLLTLANNGPSDAQAATFVDQLPQHETLVSFHQDSGPGVGGALPPGGVETFTMVVHIDASTPDNTVITNTATGFSSTFDPNGANNVASASTTITTQADVVMTKTGPATAIAGTNITYLLTLANNGPSDAQAATFVDQLPQHETLVSFHQDSGPGVGGALPPGGVETFTMVVHIDASTPNNTVITNKATGFSSTFDPNGVNNVASASTTITTQANLAMSISGPASGTAGSDATYTLTLTNNGPSDAQSAVLSDPLPAHTSLVSFTQNSGPALGGTLPAGGIEVFTLVVHIDSSTPINTVITIMPTATCPTTDPDTSNNTATANTTVIA